MKCVPYALHAHTVLISSTSQVLCLILMVTLQLLWRFFHAFSITGCYAEIPQPLWKLRLFVFSVTVELILSLSITIFFLQNYQSCTVCLIFFYTHLTNGSTSPFLSGNIRTSVLATETLTDLSSSVCFS
jgi:hypothetical protein